jgi:hypothetical protein
MNYIALLACWASFSSLPRPMSSQAQTGLKPKRRVHWESLVALLNSGTRGPQASRASRSDRKRSQAQAHTHRRRSGEARQVRSMRTSNRRAMEVGRGIHQVSPDSP